MDPQGSIQKFYKRVRFFLSALMDSDLAYYAAGLSFYTIFTIIPLLLIVLTLFTSMPGFSNYYLMIREFIFSNLMPMNSEAFMRYIDMFLQNSVEMSMVSFAFVVLSSLLFFQNFEYIANKIFHVKKRGFWESVTIFWTLLTLAPIGLGLSFYISGNIALLLESEYKTGINILPLMPYLILWALFFLIFKIAANTKVQTKAAFFSSFITSTAFNIAKNGFIYYVFYNKSYETIYGSFSIIMFLFLWIYLSWIIFIYGLKLCYLIQSIEKDGTAEER